MANAVKNKFRSNFQPSVVYQTLCCVFIVCSLLCCRSRCYSIMNPSQITWPWSVSGFLTGLERYGSLMRLQLISYCILLHCEPVSSPFRWDLRFSSTLAIYSALLHTLNEEHFSEGSQAHLRFISFGKSHMPVVALWSVKGNGSAVLHIVLNRRHCYSCGNLNRYILHVLTFHLIIEIFSFVLFSSLSGTTVGAPLCHKRQANKIGLCENIGCKYFVFHILYFNSFLWIYTYFLVLYFWK